MKRAPGEQKKRLSYATLERKVRQLNADLGKSRLILKADRAVKSAVIRRYHADNIRLRDLLQQFKDKETDRAHQQIREAAFEQRTGRKLV